MRRASVLAGALALVLGLLCLCNTEGGREAGWRALVGTGKQEAAGFTWTYMVTPNERTKQRMAKAAIATPMGGSCVLQWSFGVEDDEAGIHSITVGLGGPSVSIVYGEGADPDKEYLQVNVVGMGMGYIAVDKPTEGNPTAVSIPITFVQPNAYLEVTSGTVPIGAKGATHAKEMTITEQWALLPEQLFVCTVGDLEFSSTDFAGTTSLVMGFRLELDPDTWADKGKYAFSVTDISFCGEAADLSGLIPRVIYDEMPAGRIYAEGTADGTIGLWQADGTGMVTYNYPTLAGNVSAPLSFDFSNMDCRWMDGSAADSVEVYCTGLRTLNSSGVDIGPWHGTLAALKALGRVKQKYGLWTNS